MLVHAFEVVARKLDGTTDALDTLGGEGSYTTVCWNDRFVGVLEVLDVVVLGLAVR